MADTTVVGSIAVKVSPDTDDFRNQLRRLLQRMEREVTGIVHVAADLDTARLRADFAAMMARLRVDAARGINIRAEITRGLGDRLQGVTSGLDRLTGSADAASGALGGVGRTGLLVAGVAAAAAPAVGLVSGLLAGMPSLMTSFAAGAGAIALGMDGIKAAAENLRPEFDSLKASVSGLFEQRFAGLFDQLGAVFPVLETGMAQVANGMSDMLGGVTNALTSGVGLEQLRNILAQTGSMFSALQPVVGTFTQSFLTLSNAGANSFGILTNTLGTFATQFNEMVDRITTNGAFEGAMQGMSQTLSGVLSAFTRLMESGVQAMGQLGGPLNNMLGGVTDALVAVMPALTSFSSLVGNVIGELGRQLAPVITALTPAFTQLSTMVGTLLTGALQQLGPVLTEVATSLSSTLLPAFQQMEPMLPTLVTAFGQVAQAIGGALIQGVQALAPHLPAMVQSFSQLATTLSGQLAQYLPQLGESFGKILAAVTPLLPVFARLASDVLTPLVPVLAQLLSVITPVIGALANMLSVSTSLAGGFESAKQAVMTFCSDAIQGIVNFVTTAVTEVSALPGKFTAALGDVGSLLVDSGKALVQGFITGITSMAGAAADAASGLLSKVRSFFPFSPAKQGPFSGSGWVDSSGESIGKAFGDGLQSTQAKIVEIARALMQAIKDVFGDAHGLALNFNFGGNNAFGALQDSLAGVSGAAKDMSRSFASSANPTRKLDDESRQMLQQLDLQKDQLELERKKLDVSKSMAGSKAEKQVIQDQIDQLNLQKKQLAVQMDQVKLGGKYENSVTAVADGYNDQFKKLQQIPTDVMKANVDQGLSDLGIGGGAITGGAAAAIGWGQEALGNVFNFNVSNIDEAMAVKQRQTNLDALGIQGR